MKFLLNFSFVFFLITGLHAQLTAENEVVLRAELTKQVNALRVKKGLKPLQNSDILQQAAAFHSNYMLTNNELTHIEKVIEVSSPTKRVMKFGGTMFEMIGENVLYTIPYSFPVSKETLLKIATDIYISWEKSPQHYANMIKPEYEFGDFGFAVNQKTGVIYATQVFARKGLQVPNQLSTNGFYLKDGSSSCKDAFKGYFNLVTNLGNATHIEGDKVLLYHSDIDLMRKLLTSPKDGLAVDLVKKSQFNCGKANQLDMSPVYDGILLQPIYTADILGNNSAESDYRLITTIGEIPHNLNPKEYSVSLILIKNGRKCVYLIPGEVPNDFFTLVEYKPKFVEGTNYSFKYQGVINSEVVKYSFKSSDTIPISFPQLNTSGKKIHSVYIQSFTSIDGDSDFNQVLHTSRAEVIKRHIQKSTKLIDEQITIEAKENWDLMNFQFLYNFLDELIELPHDTIKSIIAKTPELPWAKLLFDQRRSTATINYYGQLSSNASLQQLADLNLRTALLSKKWDMANKAIYTLSLKNQTADYLLESPYFEIIKNQPELVQNVSAILTPNAKLHQERISEYIYTWISRVNELDSDSKVNLSNLYCHVAYDLLKTWDLPAQSLSNVIKPELVKNITDGIELSDEMKLNINLTFLNYFGQTNNTKEINNSFGFIESYFKSKTLSVEDEVNLVLFFNSWSRYDLTIERLLPIYNSGKLNKEGCFVLMQTLQFYALNENEKLTRDITLKVKELYPKEWCTWLKKNFQLMRDEELKKAYCSICAK